MHRKNFNDARVSTDPPPSSLQAAPWIRLGIEAPRSLAKLQMRVPALLGHLAVERARANDDGALGSRACRVFGVSPFIETPHTNTYPTMDQCHDHRLVMKVSLQTSVDKDFGASNNNNMRVFTGKLCFSKPQFGVKWGCPQIINPNRIFHYQYKPSISGCPSFLSICCKKRGPAP